VGHTAAAKAVAGALLELVPNVEIQTVDSYKYAASVLSKVVADGYIGMVKTVPQVYRYIYDRAERARDIPAFRRWVNQYTASNLRALVTERAPDVVVCTHAFPCGVMSEYKRQFDPHLPVAGIVTDFVVHPFWIYPNIDLYAVATPEMRQTLLGRGIASERIELSGIPVDPRFGTERLPVAELRASLGLPVDRRIVLMMGGGLGIGPLDVMIRALGRLDVPVAGTIIVGRNGGVEKRVLALAESIEYPLRVMGFVDNVYDYMRATRRARFQAGRAYVLGSVERRVADGVGEAVARPGGAQHALSGVASRGGAGQRRTATGACGRVYLAIARTARPFTRSHRRAAPA
jgi:processive 1,2-diacylglycerol beta-glucosyltransferase